MSRLLQIPVASTRPAGSLMRSACLPLAAILLLVSGCGGADPANRGIEPGAVRAAIPVASDPGARETGKPPELPDIEADDLAKGVRKNLELAYEGLTYRMELQDSSGALEVRRVLFHRATNLDGKDCAYTRFLAPEEIAGFGLLNTRRADEEPEQFLYVPAARKVSRILYFSTNRQSSFCGTQFTFEDLEPLRLRDFKFTSMGTAWWEGRACYLLALTPATRYSGYSRILNWVDSGTFLVLRSEFQDLKGDHFKTAVNRDLFEAAPGHWRARKSEIVNLRNDRATRLELLDHAREEAEASPEKRGIFTIKTLSLGKEG